MLEIADALPRKIIANEGINTIRSEVTQLLAFTASCRTLELVWPCVRTEPVSKRMVACNGQRHDISMLGSI
jgi:hypothetical protein